MVTRLLPRGSVAIVRLNRTVKPTFVQVEYEEDATSGSCL